jgi:adenine-specific DNA-methyltransferase
MSIRRISPHAKRLRKNMTDAETVMWHRLRGRRLSGYKFKRQWTLGNFVVDFCCSEAKLVIEIDGGQHTPERDRARTSWLESQGFQVRRFWNDEVLTNMDGVLTVVLHDLQTQTLTPTPLPQAGEGLS